MKIPKRLQPLIEDGVIDCVLAQLKSGKEAAVYLVDVGGQERCAKVYKEAQSRSFRQAATYQEGRNYKNSRRARAIEKGSRYGKQEQESAWQSAEADALLKLNRAGLRVPNCYGFFEGVLLMDVITDENGRPAPRLSDVVFSEQEALANHAILIEQVVKMLLAGLVHGDLSEFNILMAAEGPIIIDLPQAVDAANNNHARDFFMRDLQNLADFFGQFAPQLLETNYGGEIWQHYAAGELTENTVLTGQYQAPEHEADVGSVLREIEETLKEEAARQRRLSGEEPEDDPYANNSDTKY